MKDKTSRRGDRPRELSRGIALLVWVLSAGGCGDLTLTALVPLDAGPGHSEAGVDAAPADAGNDHVVADAEGDALPDARGPVDLSPADDAGPCAGKACGADCTPPGMGMLVTCNAQGQCVPGPVTCE